MLDEHLLDGGDGEIGIERLPAERNETLESFGELRVLLFFATDDVGHLLADLGEAILELGDGLFPLVERRGLILEESRRISTRLSGLEMSRSSALAILHEHGACGDWKRMLSRG